MTATGQQAPQGGLTPARGTLLLVVFGLACRFAVFVSGAPLWGDEAMLALGLATRSFGELRPPLEYGQVSPVPFLAATRALIALGGINEHALRAVPFLFGCLSLIGVAIVTRRLLRPWEAVIAVGLASTSSFLIRYSAELKPYALDVFVATALIWAALRHERGERTWSRVLLLAGICAAGVTLSAPAPFACLGVSAYLLMRERPPGSVAGVGRSAVLTLVWATTAVASYGLWYRDAASTPYMTQFWQAAMLRPGSPDLAERTWGAIEVTVQGLLDWVVLLRLTPLALGLAVAGIVALGRRQGFAVPVLLILPGVAAFVASALGWYPVSTRTMLFWLPALAMVLGTGLVVFAEALRRLVPGLRAPVTACAFLIPSVTVAAAGAVVQKPDEDVRAVIAGMESHRAPGDPVYVLARYIPNWAYYTTDWERADGDRLAWIARMAGTEGPSFGNAASRGRRVPMEYDSLSRPFRDGLELLGSSSGIQVRQWTGYSSRSPDPGWAAGEAARIRDAAAPRCWIVGAAGVGSVELDELLGAVAALGGWAIQRVRAGNATAVLVAFQ